MQYDVLMADFDERRARCDAPHLPSLSCIPPARCTLLCCALLASECPHARAHAHLAGSRYSWWPRPGLTLSCRDPFDSQAAMTHMQQMALHQAAQAQMQMAHGQ